MTKPHSSSSIHTHTLDPGRCLASQLSLFVCSPFTASALPVCYHLSLLCVEVASSGLKKNAHDNPFSLVSPLYPSGISPSILPSCYQLFSLFFQVHVPKMTHPEGPRPIFQVKSADPLSSFGLRIVGVFVMKRIIGVFVMKLVC